MRVKTPKCRSLSFKVFKKGVDDRFTPASETRYSAFDPRLSVSGKSIPFLGDEPFKFLGRKMSSKKNGLPRAEIKGNFVGNLEITSKAFTSLPWPYRLQCS